DRRVAPRRMTIAPLRLGAGGPDQREHEGVVADGVVRADRGAERDDPLAVLVGEIRVPDGREQAEQDDRLAERVVDRGGVLLGGGLQGRRAVQRPLEAPLEVQRVGLAERRDRRHSTTERAPGDGASWTRPTQSASASFRFRLVAIPARSTPSATRLWATAGRMPEIWQEAPSSSAARHKLIR